MSTDDELNLAVNSAEAAFPAWRDAGVLKRQQIMFRYVNLIRSHWDRLAASITLEQGKTLADARGDVLRGLQVTETACEITTQITGEVLEVSKDMETRNYKEPLGVVAAICPFSKSGIRIRVSVSDFEPHRFSCNNTDLEHTNCNSDWEHNSHQVL
jgi:malonate-semialdehyde dehydrogenase (acetylating) / methylmalonate-semialdehyde dehydrogenase